ncbi:MAG: hypothetical protein M1480_19330 [Bacteroidetes bacterium]|nr:hypothetical protein [Bacteroidota bacterium]
MDNSQQTTTGSLLRVDDGKTIAIISYLSIIGWIIAYIMYGNNKAPLAAFHLRQTITLYIASLAVWIVEMILAFIPVIGILASIAAIFLYIAFFIFWIIGFIAAVNGQEKAMPFIGVQAQAWFRGI